MSSSTGLVSTGEEVMTLFLDSRSYHPYVKITKANVGVLRPPRVCRSWAKVSIQQAAVDRRTGVTRDTFVWTVIIFLIKWVCSLYFCRVGDLMSFLQTLRLCFRLRIIIATLSPIEEHSSAAMDPG